jgi:hypothetical protein
MEEESDTGLPVSNDEGYTASGEEENTLPISNDEGYTTEG